MQNYLETQVDKLVKRINDIGFHAHKNHSQRNIDGTFMKGEPYDYDMFLPNYKACFDTKMCEAEKWHMKPKDIKQSNNLKKCKKAGMNAFFLVYFPKTKQLLAFDIDVIAKELETTKSIRPELGIKWEIEKIIKEAGRC